MALIMGSVEPFHHRAKKVNKGTSAGITRGHVCIQDTATTPDSWKTATAGVTAGPFVICINADAATADTHFTACVSGEVTVKADGAIEPGKYVMSSAATAGEVVVWDGTNASAKVGVYLGDKGNNAVEAAADGDVIRIIKEAD